MVELNRTGELAQPDARVLEVLRYSQELADRTQGAFDVTVQPLWTAFTQAKAQGGLPEPKRIAAAQRWWTGAAWSVGATRCGCGGPAWRSRSTAWRRAMPPTARWRAVRRHGVEHALIDAGEFDTLGRKRMAKPGCLASAPARADALAARLAMDGRALATSGDYETFFTPDFLHHHIFDPATGDSPTELASTSVLAPNALAGRRPVHRLHGAGRRSARWRWPRRCRAWTRC